MNTRTEPRLDIWTTKRTGKTGGMFTVPEKDAEAAYERLCEIRNEHDAKRPPRARRPWVSSISAPVHRVCPEDLPNGTTRSV